MDSPPKKRGRGRPPGSLNVKGSKKRGYVEESQDTPSTASTHVLERQAREQSSSVDFESDPPGGEDFSSEEETMSAVEELPPSPPPSPKPVGKKPAPQRRVQEPVPAPVTQPASKPAAKPRKPRAVPKREAAQSAGAELPRQETPPQLTPDDYLGFLRKITDISNARNRSARVERYDNFFRV